MSKTDKIVEILKDQVSIRSTKSCVQIAKEIHFLYTTEISEDIDDLIDEFEGEFVGYPYDKEWNRNSNDGAVWVKPHHVIKWLREKFALSKGAKGVSDGLTDEDKRPLIEIDDMRMDELWREDSLYSISEVHRIRFMAGIKAAIKELNSGAKGVSDEVKICTGCGRLSTDEPIKPPALACCPDNHYLPVKKYWERSCYPSNEYQKRT